MTAGPDPGAWRELRALLERALEVSPEERRALLAELAARDPARAAELEELLRADAAEGSPLDAGAGALLAGLGEEGAAPAGAAGGRAPLTGRRLGAWRLGELLGQGGMGAVYAARRVEGEFEQEAAVKVLRASADSPELRARFRRERQLLASLGHPAIARLLDGGVEDGELWFALERVEGVPITAHARARGLTVSERLTLFLAVCDAVEAAHRRLVVHRDLKPSNILVTAAGEVKLLDFGIAKLLEGDEGEALTRSEARPLTPRYAAPEQILGAPPTTGMDVYALGVVLYELLTGSLPHDRSTASPVALARELERETVAPPSRRVLTGDEAGRRLARRLTGDLDAILLRALRPEPERRYASVAELTNDLRLHLAGRPVGARGGAWRYRAGSFVRRHRLAVLAATLVVAALVAGLGVAAWQARIARVERDRARVEAAKATEVARFMTRLFHQADPARARGASLTAREVLAAGGERVEQDLAGQPEIQATLLLAIGSVERDLGLYAEAAPRLERALALRERSFGAGSLEVAEALHELGQLDRYFDRLEEGRARLELALALRETALGPDHLEVARTLSALGVVQRYAGEIEASRASFERALAIADRFGQEDDETGRWWNSLGLVLSDLGAYAEAEPVFHRSLEVLERSAGPGNPLLALPLDNLGMLLRTQERFEEALPLLERARTLVETTWGPDHVQFGTALNSLGVLLGNLDRCAEAVELLARAADVYGRALGSEHRFVAWPLVAEGDCRLALGEPETALALFERAASIRLAALGAEHAEHALALGRIGLAEQALGRTAAAERRFREALAILRRTLDPASPAVAEAIVDLAACLEHRGAAAEASALYEEAARTFRAAYPQGHSYVTRVEAALVRLAAGG